MTYRIIGEFDSVELAELAAGKIKARFPDVCRVSVKSVVGRGGENAEPPVAFPMLSGPGSSFSLIWDNDDKKNDLPEPFENKAAVLSFDIGKEHLKDALGLLTALGGRSSEIF